MNVKLVPVIIGVTMAFGIVIVLPSLRTFEIYYGISPLVSGGYMIVMSFFNIIGVIRLSEGN